MDLGNGCKKQKQVIESRLKIPFRKWHRTEVKEEKKEEKSQTSSPVSNEDVRSETTKPRFNEPEFKELSEKRLFVSSFTTAQDLLDSIKKDYMVSRVMTEKLCELWEFCLGEQGETEPEDLDRDANDLPF